jgi:hypothetical protein
MGGVWIIGRLFLLYNGIDQNLKSHRQADTIMFTGKTVNPVSGEWNNNRLVLVFEREKEVGRTITYQGEFPESDLGIIDGLFVVEIPNTYKFTVADFRANQVPFDFYITSRSDGFMSNRKIIYHWFPEFPEGSLTHINMESKNLDYTIYILNGDVSTLPPEIMGGTTEFRLGQLFVISPETLPSGVNPPVDGEYYLQDVVYNTSIDQVTLNKITIPLDNCKSEIELQTPYSYSQTYIHKYTQEDTIGGGLNVSIPKLEWAKIVFELQSKYGFEDSQVDSNTITYDLRAAPHSYQFYTVTWTEIWENGVANVVKDNQLVTVPFRVKTNLVYDVASETRACP